MKRKRRKRTNSNVPAKGRLRDMADQLWSNAVRTDWNWQCAVCGKGKCEAHHLIPRQHEATRYTLRNGIALCSSHHQFDKHVSPHQNAAGWIQWLQEHHPELAHWYQEETAAPLWFEGTTSADYYCGIIRRLDEFVSEADFVRIVGARFSEWVRDQT